MLSDGHNEYTLETRWSIRGDIKDAYTILSKPLEYPEWWGLKFFMAREMVPAGISGLGQTVEFEMKGWLPYRLRWQLTSAEAEKPYHIAGVSTGDFEGRGIWSLKQRGEWADITFDWKITARHPFLRRWSIILRPFFLWNHQWVMKKAKQGMAKKIAE